MDSESTKPYQSAARNPSRGGAARQRGGGRGRDQRGRGGGRGGGGRGKGSDRGRGERKGKGEQGRAEWSRNPVDKRKRNNDEQESKRRKLEDGTAEPSLVGVKYSAEEIASEDRKPKRKVAVCIGYAGTGYKGMQINDKEKTIEGDLFNAFVKAGAISKANADDPKKSSLVRCARTDKGVHAAGNVVSLKLIVEDPEIVQKINEHLPSQIRVWGYERTNGSFSCYQTCDSRWYEYLIPTYSFLPPHPRSYLGKKLVDSAEKEGVYESYQSRQEETSSFWEQTEKEYVEPILAKLDPQMRVAVMEAIHTPIEDAEKTKPNEVVGEESKAGGDAKKEETVEGDMGEPNAANDSTSAPVDVEDGKATIDLDNGESKQEVAKPEKPRRVATPLEVAVAEVKAAYLRAKKAYRIAPVRRQRVQDALNKYVGTRNYHNYTIQKGFKDASANRVIRSFNVGEAPIIINDTEWLSLKVHGQSFMMHQIRKMVAMAALIVRCGCTLDRINDSYGPDKISIPKAPSLGLLLERPVFDSYNKRAVEDLEKEKIDFGKYEKEMDEFKQKEIYERIFKVENEENQFHVFFHHIDCYKSNYFLWITASGLAASEQALAAKGENGKVSNRKMAEDSDDEGDVGNEEG